MVPAASIVINALIAPLSLAAWFMLMWHKGESAQLTHRGLKSLKYFTVQSNLFSAMVSTVYVAVCLSGMEQLPLWLIILKLVAATAVMLTLITVIVLLAPRYGWRSMFSGGNLWLHLILPLFAAVDCCLFVPIAQIPFWMTLYVWVPSIVYGLFYLSRILIHGAEENDVVYDHYGFLRWGWKWLSVVLAGMLLATWVIALTLRAVASLIGA